MCVCVHPIHHHTHASTPHMHLYIAYSFVIVVDVFQKMTLVPERGGGSVVCVSVCLCVSMCACVVVLVPERDVASWCMYVMFLLRCYTHGS